MITEKEYENGLRLLADECVINQLAPANYLEKLLLEENKEAIDLFIFRYFFFDKHDLEKVRGYLKIGFYIGKTEEERVIFFCLEFELETLIRRKCLINLCKKYNDQQALFVQHPNLIEFIRIKGSRKGKPSNELVDYYALKQLGKSEIIKFDNSFTKLSGLNSRLSEWIALELPDCPLFVRVNPDIVSDTQLPQLLTEELQINPHNLDWASFKFKDALFTAVQYDLQDIEISLETRAEFWDYKIRGIRSLQISTSRNDKYRSFMIEELNDKNGDDEILIGKCIHFDSKSFDDSKIHEQVLDHLDLAINVYETGNRTLRLNETLCNGKITDADYRTHFLRIDNVPFKSVPVFLLLFLSGTILTNKYLNDILQ